VVDLLIDEQLCQQLVGMRADDMRVRVKLEAGNEVGGPYVPRIKAVHVKRAARLTELIDWHGWPADAVAGRDGAEGAWLIAQNPIGAPEF
jgi:hypothetical protein